MGQRGFEPASACLCLEFFAGEAGLGDHSLKRLPRPIGSRAMHDDVVAFGMRHWHGLSPCHGLDHCVIKATSKRARSRRHPASLGSLEHETVAAGRECSSA